jgi:hypothetical protein
MHAALDADWESLRSFAAFVEAGSLPARRARWA